MMLTVRVVMKDGVLGVRAAGTLDDRGVIFDSCSRLCCMETRFLGIKKKTLS